MENIVIISSLNDVVATLENLLDDSSTELPYKIKVKELPNFELYLKGDKFDNSITPSIMAGIIELQNAIYRAYLLARYGTDNLQTLNDYERRTLELKVVVNPGSTEIIANICDLAKSLFELISGMENKQKYIIILLTLAIIGGGVGWLYFNSYLNHQAAKLEIDKEVIIERERTKQLIESQKNIIKAVQVSIEAQHGNNNVDTDSSSDSNEEKVSESDVSTQPKIKDDEKVISFKPLKQPNQELLATIARAKKSSPEASLVTERTEESMRKLMASTANADFVRFNNQFEASGYAMYKIASVQRTDSESVTIQKLFRVLNVDSKKTEFMQARLRATDQSYPDFNAKFSDTSIGQDKLERLTSALTSYHPIHLSITAKERKGKLHDAFIAQVRDIDSTRSFKEGVTDSMDA